MKFPKETVYISSCKLVLNAFIIVAILFSIQSIKAQECPSYNLSFTTQSAIDQFINDYPNCSEIKENLTLQGNAITNLDAFTNITSIKGDVNIINCNALTNIDGLQNVSSINGYLLISQNNNIENIDGLANLTTIDDDLFIENNENLSNLSGLVSLISIGDYFTIENNMLLSNLNGLVNLTSIGGNFRIKNNILLADINGLSSLTYIGRELVINNNNLLENIDGLANLAFIGRDLNIYNNDNLKNLNGLLSLSNITRSLLILENDVLNDIDGLINLNTMGTNGVSIKNNPLLTTCCVVPHLDILSGGNIEISGNSTNCNDLFSIESYCDNVSSNDESNLNFNNQIQVSVLEESLSISITAYRNDNANLAIFDLSGNLILSEKIVFSSGKNIVNFDLSYFPKGIFLINLGYEDTVYKNLFIR